MPATELGGVHPCGAHFEDMKAAGLRGSRRAADASQCVAGSESSKRGPETPLCVVEKTNPQCRVHDLAGARTTEERGAWSRAGSRKNASVPSVSELESSG